MHIYKHRFIHIPSIYTIYCCNKIECSKREKYEKDYKQFINEMIQIHNSLCYQQATNYYA